jgi:molybdopterin/thiamine biosynthesis adenylyltransferase
MTRLEIITQVVSSIVGVTITSPFETTKGGAIVTSFEMSIGSVALSFKVHIDPTYPLQFHGSETIYFYNRDLIEYDHVMKNGLVCIHTVHSPDLAQKLLFDFNSLKEWISRFYINKESETHYEHIVVPYAGNDFYLFTDVETDFKKGDHGIVKYSKLADSNFQETNTQTFIIQEFQKNAKEIACQWSKVYRELPKEMGLFTFLERPPVTNRKFAIENWLEFDSFLTPEFLGVLYKFQRQVGQKKAFPLLVGYRISEREFHWQAIQIKGNDSPVSGAKIKGTKNYAGELKDKQIRWAQTKNCSYNYFFGRGALDKRITDSNILIIGVGAVGSMVATSLIRGGCRKIMLTDHDKKEPENVCRSEYHFRTGVTQKVAELSKALSSISPFAEVSSLDVLMDAAKIFLESDRYSVGLGERLNEYDIIFDCSTDDDVAYVLERYKVRAQIFNLSITNHAKELICAASPGVYEWLRTISQKLAVDDPDLYNPTGCWNPTFKASHNDIAVLVQFALKQINMYHQQGMPMRSFYLSTTHDEGFSINLKQF